MSMTKKILIVDDEPDIIEFLSYRFRKNGFEVYASNDGASALSLMNTITPDIILLDIMMPYMNGIMMCKYLKDDERFKKIPVIFLSAVQNDYQVIAAIEAGGDHYISKPVKFELIYTIVYEMLEKSQAVSSI